MQRYLFSTGAVAAAAFVPVNYALSSPQYGLASDSEVGDAMWSTTLAARVALFHLPNSGFGWGFECSDRFRAA